MWAGPSEGGQERAYRWDIFVKNLFIFATGTGNVM
jgi:hypothetical protein